MTFRLSFRIAAVALGAVTIAACGGDAGRSSNSLTGPSQTASATPAGTAGGGIQTPQAGGGNPNGADLQMSGSASTGAPDAGAPITYTYLVKNAGPATSDSVALTDVLPAGTQFGSAAVTAFSGVGGPIGCTTSDVGPTITCTVGSMPKGASATIAVTLLAPVTAGTFLNVAVVSGAAPDPSPTNNAVTISAQVKVGLLGGACALPPGQTTMHGMVMWTGSTTLASGQQAIQNFAFMSDAGVLYWVQTNFYDAASPLSSVINLDCKTSPVQFVVTGEFVTVTGIVGTDTIQLFPASAGVPPAPTFALSVVQVPTHKDKI